MADVTAMRDEWMRRTGPLYPGLVALCCLTVVPLPYGLDPTEEDLARSAPWFPVIGAVIGAALATLAWLLLQTELVPAATAIIVLIAHAVITRGAHEIGVAETVRHIANPRASSARATQQTSYGVLAILALVALRGTGLLGMNPDRWLGALIVSSVIARWCVVLLDKIGDHLDDPRFDRSQPATLLIGTISWPVFGVASAIAAVITLWLAGGLGFVAIISAAAAALAMGLYAQRRFGGMTHQLLAACAAVIEVVVLIAFAWDSPSLVSPWAN